jgi:predicted DsbA family dithiol-disulfide isomerase
VADTLIVYTDYVAPACYLAEAVLDELLAVEPLRIERRPFELFPAPAALPDFSAEEEAAAWRAEIEPLAERLGVRIERPRRAVRTAKAHEAVLLAARHGLGDALHRALMEAYFAQGMDIGRTDVLVRLGEGGGVDRSEMKVALDLDTHAAEAAESRSAALAAGIRGAPAFVTVDEQRVRALVGWHGAAAIRDWLDGRRPDGRPGT